MQNNIEFSAKELLYKDNNFTVSITDEDDNILNLNGKIIYLVYVVLNIITHLNYLRTKYLLTRYRINELDYLKKLSLITL